MSEITVYDGQAIEVAYDVNETISDSTRDRIVRSVAEGTRRAYDGDFNRYEEWCAEVGRRALPSSPETLAEYVSHLADKNLAPSSIDRALSSILIAHSTAGIDRPLTGLARAALKTHRGDRAEAGYRKRRASAISVDNIAAMTEALPDTAAGERDAAIIVLGFALGARRSEVAGLNITDLTAVDSGYDVVIRISKTDKDAEGREVSVLYGSNPKTCPVRVVRRWLDRLAASGRTTGPLFLRIDKHDVIGRAPSGRGSADGRITGQGVALVINRAARRAALDPAMAWTGHSLRRGFATATYGKGADPLRIARHGGWKDGSTTLYGYIEDVDKVSKNPLIGIGL